MPEAKVTFAKELYAKQKAAIFTDKRFAICEASTKSGKTMGAIQFLIMEAWEKGGEGKSFHWIAPTYGQSKIAFQRSDRALPKGMVRRTNATELTITLINGAILRFLSGDRPDTLFGDDSYGAVMDECSRMHPEAWTATRSMLTATSGRSVLIGNVKGRRNWFYELARKAENGEPEWHYSRLNAYDAVEGGILPAEEIESARRMLPEAVFQELYMAEPSDDSGNPFGHDNIAACVREISTEPPAVFGVDLARSIDWTVVVGLDSRGVVCYFDRFQHDWELTERRIADAIGHLPTAVDVTGIGDVMFDRLSRKCSGVERYHFSQNSKQTLMEGLVVAIQQGEIGYPSGVIVSELMDFEFQYSASGVKYAASGSAHDDAVIGLALANYQFQNRPGRGIWL